MDKTSWIHFDLCIIPVERFYVEKQYEALKVETIFHIVCTIDTYDSILCIPKLSRGFSGPFGRFSQVYINTHIVQVLCIS